MPTPDLPPEETDVRPAAASTDETVDESRPQSGSAENDEIQEDEFCRLDDRLIGLTRCANAITFAVIGAVALAGGTPLLWVIPYPWLFVIPLLWVALGGWCVVSVIWWPLLEHERWSYRVGNKVVELRYGVIWREHVSIPLTRLQHIDLHLGPLERRWGLASLEIHTAGTQNAAHRLPGLDIATARNLRDRLVDAAGRGSRQTDNQPPISTNA